MHIFSTGAEEMLSQPQRKMVVIRVLCVLVLPLTCAGQGPEPVHCKAPSHRQSAFPCFQSILLLWRDSPRHCVGRSRGVTPQERKGVAAVRANAGAKGDDKDAGPIFHELPPGAPGSSIWRGIPLDRQRLIQERSQARNLEVRLNGQRAPPTEALPPMPREKKRKDTAETFFSNTYRRGLPPHRGGEDFSFGGPNPRTSDDRRSLRPTQAGRNAGAKIADGLRTSTRSFFDDSRSLKPPSASSSAGNADTASASRLPLTTRYSMPLSGLNPPAPYQKRGENNNNAADRCLVVA